ncbi:MAG: ABC-2 family transporter protein [Candidatus Nomurabacteria bacterium]|nr:ABC-2 family transporter protein [Candidatus Nomurabacteria bacterium]
MKQLRLANSIVKMMIKDRIQYPARLIVDTFGIATRCGVLLILYYYIFSTRGGVINGLTFQITAWSMFLYFAFMTLRLRDLATSIMQDIKSGTVEVLLSKPINYLSYRMWWQLGAGLYPFFVAVVLGTIALVVAVGIPASMSSWFFVGTLSIVFILGIILSLLVYAVVGLLAFWIEDIKPLYWIVDKAVMILGGSYLPVALFPKVMYQIAIWSPFGASQFVTHTVYDTWRTGYAEMIGIQVFWIVILGIIVSYMFGRAHKKVSVNGG